MANKHTTESLRSFYRLGRQVCEADSKGVDPVTGRRASGSFARLCERIGRSRNELAKARKFARLYSGARLKTLCSLGTKAGRPLTKTHMCRLVVVSNGTLRNKLARECAKQCWSVLRLEYEIQRIQTKREYGGRKPIRPKSVDEALVETLRIINRWIRLTDVLLPSEEERPTAEVSMRKLPAGIRNRHLIITAEMNQLQRQIWRLMKRHTRRQRKASRRSGSD